MVTSQAVTGGPYLAVDLNGDGWENVPVNASQSTAAGSSTIDFAAWMVGDEVLGTGLVTSLRLPVGDTNVTLTLVDSTGSSFSDETVIRVEASEAPPPTALSAPAPNTSNTETTGRNAILINCGGAPNYTDTAGRLWLSDIYFDGRSESMESPDLGIDIANTEDDVLYQSYRQGYSSSNFTYSIPVPSGMYTIILHFSEPL